MSPSAIRRGMLLPLLCWVVQACSSPKSGTRAAGDPGAPAIVTRPSVVLASDTAKPSTIPRPVVALEDAKREVATNLAVLGMAITVGDRRMIGATYATDAEFVTADTTYRGAAAIANGLGALGPAKGLRDFQRRSVAMRIVDSTVVDSGTYALLTKRAGADSLMERGRYATTWRMHAQPLHWLIVRDHLYRDRAAKAK